MTQVTVNLGARDVNAERAPWLVPTMMGWHQVYLQLTRSATVARELPRRRVYTRGGARVKGVMAIGKKLARGSGAAIDSSGPHHVHINKA